MLYFIAGPDRTRARRFLEEESARLLTAHPQASVFTINTEDLEGDALLSRLRPLISNRSLFPEPRVVKVYECLGELSTRDWPSFQEFLSTSRVQEQDLHLFFFENDATLFRELPKPSLGVVLRPFPFLSRRELATWIQDEAAGLGGKIDRQASELLTDTLGPETAALATEIRRLVAFTSGATIQASHIPVASEEVATQESAFAVLRALERGDLSQALRQLSHVRERSHNLSHLLAILSWQLRSLIAVRRYSGHQRGRAGATPTFRRYRAQQLLALLHEVDERWKSGQEDPLLALERYFIEFTSRAA